MADLLEHGGHALGREEACDDYPVLWNVRSGDRIPECVPECLAVVLQRSISIIEIPMIVEINIAADADKVSAVDGSAESVAAVFGRTALSAMIAAPMIETKIVPESRKLPGLDTITESIADTIGDDQDIARVLIEELVRLHVERLRVGVPDSPTDADDLSRSVVVV